MAHTFELVVHVVPLSRPPIPLLRTMDDHSQSERLSESWSVESQVDLARLRSLLESGASVNASDQDGRTFLFVGARENDVK